VLGGSFPDGNGTVAPIAASERTFTKLTFQQEVAAAVVQGAIADAAKKLNKDGSLGVTPVDVLVYPDATDLTDWSLQSGQRYKSWYVNIDAPEKDGSVILSQLQADMHKEKVWRSSDEIGTTVANNFKVQAILAMFASILGIIGYIWIRFQRVVFGLAAVVALLHDVLVTLGAIALSYWAASALGFLQVDEFKIGLTVVAAFLTIVGYSLNDTIVVFDRIREVRGKNPNLSGEMINKSINQTLSRTLLTSITTFIVVVILYFAGGEGIHAFAFTLVIGVLVGTYSSIFIASPALLWMMGFNKVEPKNQKPATSK